MNVNAIQSFYKPAQAAGPARTADSAASANAFAATADTGSTGKGPGERDAVDVFRGQGVLTSLFAG